MSLPDEVAETLQAAGIGPGDAVFVHSDTGVFLKQVAGGFAAGLEALKEGFLRVLGPSGTLLVPAFNYDFCKGKPYVHEKTPSQMGLFSNFVLRDRQAVRSFHPIFSAAGIGAEARELLEGVSASSFGEDSLFDRLFRRDAKIVFFGAGFIACTFIHYVEQREAVPYRFLKRFTGPVSRGGIVREGAFDFYVKHLDRGIVTDLDRLERDLASAGELRRVVSASCGTVLQSSCRAVHRTAAAGLRQDPHYLLKCAPRPAGP